MVQPDNASSAAFLISEYGKYLWDVLNPAVVTKVSLFLPHPSFS